jgi:hypothetical protein
LVYIRGIEQKLRMGQGIRLGLLCLIRTFPEIAGNSSVPGLWDTRRDQMESTTPQLFGLLRVYCDWAELFSTCICSWHTRCRRTIIRGSAYGMIA